MPCADYVQSKRANNEPITGLGGQAKERWHEEDWIRIKNWKGCFSIVSLDDKYHYLLKWHIYVHLVTYQFPPLNNVLSENNLKPVDSLTF